MGAKASFLLAVTMLWWSFGSNVNTPRAEPETVQSIFAAINAADVPPPGKSLLQ